MMRRILDFSAEWGAVLRDSLPAVAQRALGLGRRYAVLQPSDGDWRLFQARGESLEPRGVCEIETLAGEMRRLEGPVVLLLPPDLAMHPVLTLPATAARSLDQVLDVEIERLTPFKAGDVAVAREVAPTADGQIRVALTIVPHVRIEAHAAPLREAGIRIAYVLADRTRIGRAAELSLRGETSGTGARNAAWVPALVTLALLAGAVISPFIVQELRLENREAALEQLAPGLDAVQRLSEEVEAARAREQALQAFLEARAPMTPLLEEISRRLPDESWLTLYQVEGDRIALEGRSSSATSLVGLLNASPMLSDARFDAPLIRDPASGADRFRLDARVSAR